jgi:hypothetical protein
MVIGEIENSGRMQPELGRATTMSSAAPTADAMLPEAPEIIDRLARDLRSLFPDMGMSSRNLKYMRAFAKAWHDPEIVQGGLAQSAADRKVPQAVAQIPWGHIRTLLDKLDDSDVRLWYATKAAEHGWSRSVLVHQIEGALHLREGKVLTNFDETLPSPQSEIAQPSTPAR